MGSMLAATRSPRLQVGAGRRAHSRGRPRGDHVARLEREHLGQEGDDSRHGKDHLGRGCVLFDLAVDREPDRHRLRVRDRVRREDARVPSGRTCRATCRASSRRTCRDRAACGPGLGLNDSIADIVDDRVAGDVAAAPRPLPRGGIVRPITMPSSHSQSMWSGEMRGRTIGSPGQVKRGARRLHEDVREGLLPLGGDAAALGDVLGVVPREEQDLGQDARSAPGAGRPGAGSSAPRDPRRRAFRARRRARGRARTRCHPAAAGPGDPPLTAGAARRHCPGCTPPRPDRWGSRR